MKIKTIYQKTELKNGLKVVSHTMPQMQTASLGIWLGVGGRYENNRNKGISHFMEHLVFKGSKKYSNRQIKESIEGVGGALNGFTSEEFTCYLAKVPSRYLYTALDILSDMAINPLLKSTDVVKERTVIIEEIKMYKDLPQQYVQDMLDELLWPNHPLGMNITGTVESVSTIKRKDLLSFKNKFYCSKNIVIAACGNIDHDQFADKINKIYPRLLCRHAIKFKKSEQKQSGFKFSSCVRDIEQTHLSLGMHALRRDDPDKYALALLNIILGGNMSSRLFHEIRERRGLAYAISAHVKRFYDTGAFLIQAGVDNHKVIPTIRLVLAELAKIRKSPVSDKELHNAKEYFIGQMVIALEDTLDHMLWIGEQAKASNRLETLEEITSSLNKVTKEDLLRLSKKIFREDKMNLAIVGPNADKVKKEIDRLIS